jgi:cytochrome c553
MGTTEQFFVVGESTLIEIPAANRTRNIWAEIVAIASCHGEQEDIVFLKKEDKVYIAKSISENFSRTKKRTVMFEGAFYCEVGDRDIEQIAANLSSLSNAISVSLARTYEIRARNTSSEYTIIFRDRKKSNMSVSILPNDRVEIQTYFAKRIISFENLNEQGYNAAKESMVAEAINLMTAATMIRR